MINEYYKNVGIKGYIQRYGWKNAYKRGFFISNPFHYINDYEINKIIWQKKAAKKIRTYLKYKNLEPEHIQYGCCNVENPIWIYWNTGLENAPEIVKKCFESVKKNVTQNIIFLSENNVNDYITLPKYILNKIEMGKIPVAAYTDLLRFSLLEHFGGTWIDATVYLSGSVPEQIMESDFFVFRNALGLLENPALFPAWFIHSTKRNKIIKEIRNVTFAYWKKESHLIEYLLPNLIITEVVKSNNYLDEILYLDSDYSERLVKVLSSEYSEKMAIWLKSLTSIHKLSYKFDSGIQKEGNFYSSIINGNF